MKIVVDDKIPYISEAVEKIADEVVYLPGKQFSRDSVMDADALIVRTRTKCDERLLEGTNVKFIATATIGYDHIDTEFCRKAGIAWENCPGCNAGGVEQYVQSSLILLARKHGVALKDMTIGVVGVGNVGRRIVEMAKSMGMKVLQCDPPRAKMEPDGDFCTFEKLATISDIITFHVPLVKTGEYKTFHYADDSFFSKVKPNCWLINTSRGEVVDTISLKKAIVEKQISDAVIDVWENEPDIDLELLENVFIGTPHIAGYSSDGKANASRMSIMNICRFFGLESQCEITPPSLECMTIVASNEDDAILQTYNPMNDCLNLKMNPEKFEWLRGNYPVRREKNAFKIIINKEK